MKENNQTAQATELEQQIARIKQLQDFTGAFEEVLLHTRERLYGPNPPSTEKESDANKPVGTIECLRHAVTDLELQLNRVSLLISSDFKDL